MDKIIEKLCSNPTPIKAKVEQQSVDESQKNNKTEQAMRKKAKMKEKSQLKRMKHTSQDKNYPFTCPANPSAGTTTVPSCIFGRKFSASGVLNHL